ncbi:MAG: S-methyl-5-thioribose-1-phosphate isomerase, partial [Deltaproteobacteria bacterium]
MTLSSKKLPTGISLVQAVSWRDGKVIILDQTALPKNERYLECRTTAQLIDAIQRLAVRGAPALGIAGAYGVVLATLEVQSQLEKNRWTALNSKLNSLALARPTAVNLSWAINQLKSTLESWNSQGKNPDENLAQLLLAQAQKIHENDIQSNRTLSELGATLLEKGAVLTVCNTGVLATGGIGTALGVLTQGFRAGKVSHVFACETRPLLQGSRLTTWELNHHQIPFTLLCDNMAASLMRREKLSAILVGADRIAANGDVANKIGTYSLAVLAKAHSVPFYVAA